MQPTVGKFDERLLQRVDSKRVLDFQVCELPITTIRIDEEFPAALEKSGSHSGIAGLGVVEITTHARPAGMRHGIVMLRLLPLGGLIAMARDASLTADVLGSGVRGIGVLLADGVRMVKPQYGQSDGNHRRHDAGPNYNAAFTSVALAL